MSAKHTPGPWKKRKGFHSDTVEIFAPNPEIKKPFYPADLAVVQTEDKEGRANARLIAAAPELLAELQNIANANTRDWEDPSDFKAWAQNRARAAIAKATGGEA